MGECVRSGFCNFMHLKPISRELRRELYGRRGAQSGLGNHGRNKVSKAKFYLKQVSLVSAVTNNIIKKIYHPYFH